MSAASVNLWGRQIGAVEWHDQFGVGEFQYAPGFVASGMEVAPFTMPLGNSPFMFTDLPCYAFNGLPGLVASALPDSFGNALINAWLARTKGSRSEFTPVDRLCYIGRRAMGALEFEPALSRDGLNHQVDVAELRALANDVLSERASLSGKIGDDDDKSALESILQVGSSAGGAQPKALLAWNPQSGEFRFGQLDADEGFQHWILKFDGATGDDARLGQPGGLGRLEYAYYQMARAAGIQMSGSRLHHEGGRSHFMARRFDRTELGEKLHMQSLWALRHFVFTAPSVHGYEEAADTIKHLGLGADAVEEQYRRAVFNIMGCNRDDHVKNISFLMDKSGQWSLSPAYDMTFCYSSEPGSSARVHQMSINGKFDNFEREDLLLFADNIGLKRSRAASCIWQVRESLGQWPDIAGESGVSDATIQHVKDRLLLHLAGHP